MQTNLVANCAPVWADWAQIFSFPLELIGVGLVLLDVYRDKLKKNADRWLFRLPDLIESLRPKEFPFWAPFWLGWGPIAAYWLYLPVNRKGFVTCALALTASLVFFAVSNRSSPAQWWRAQPLAYLLLGPFALPNLAPVYFGKGLIWIIRKVLGCSQSRQLARLGMFLAMPGVTLSGYQVAVVLAPPEQSAACEYRTPSQVLQQLFHHNPIPAVAGNFTSEKN